jgi:hypothetical protein
MMSADGQPNEIKKILGKVIDLDADTVLTRSISAIG